jgi:hypothetical protein
MNAEISSLSTEQAQRALLIFYDILPPQSWARGQKPASANLRALAERLEALAPSEVGQFIEELRNEQNAQFKGAVAKAILLQLAANEMARPYVEQAVSEAITAHMTILREIMFSMIALAALSQDIKTQSFEIHGRAPELVQQLTGFVKALPSGVYELPIHRTASPSPTSSPTPRRTR